MKMERENQLESSLAKILRCLEQHIADEAETLGVPREQLCPCYEDEINEAKELLGGQDADSRQ